MRNILQISALLVITALVLASCGGGLPLPEGGSQLSPTEIAMVDRHNAHRATLALGALAPNAKLNEIAQDQADYMAEHLNVGHEGEGGSMVWDRANAVGYVYTSLGENVGSASGGVEVFNDWLESPGHRGNIEQSQYTQIGVGMRTILGSQYWCVTFGKQP